MRLNCPVCDWKMRKGDLHRGSFACPGCKEKLRFAKSSPLEFAAVTLGSALLSFLIPYMQEHRGGSFWCEVIVLFFLFFCGSAILRVQLFPLKLERDLGLDDGTILHLTGRPDSSNKS
jgi:hypothetical protein